MEQAKKLDLTQVGISQFIMDIMAKINSSGGRKFMHEVDNQLNWVDVFPEGKTPDDGERVPLTIFADFEANRGYDYIAEKVESDLRRAAQKFD